MRPRPGRVPGDSPSGSRGRPPPPPSGRWNTPNAIYASLESEILPSVSIAQFQGADHAEEVACMERKPRLPDDDPKSQSRIHRTPIEPLQFLGHGVHQAIAPGSNALDHPGKEGVERVRTWSDRLMNSVTEELQGLDWRAVDARLTLRVVLRKPWLALHARDFLRMIRTLELCDRYGW